MIMFVYYPPENKESVSAHGYVLQHNRGLGMPLRHKQLDILVDAKFLRRYDAKTLPATNGPAWIDLSYDKISGKVARGIVTESQQKSPAPKSAPATVEAAMARPIPTPQPPKSTETPQHKLDAVREWGDPEIMSLAVESGIELKEGVTRKDLIDELIKRKIVLE